jgi:hypothetical protein
MLDGIAVYAQIALRDFELLPPSAPLPPGFFAPPEGYRTLSLEEKMDAVEARAALREGRSGDEYGGEFGGGEVEEEDGEGGWGPTRRRRRRGAAARARAASAAAAAKEEEESGGGGGDAGGAM